MIDSIPVIKSSNVHIEFICPECSEKYKGYVAIKDSIYATAICAKCKTAFSVHLIFDVKIRNVFSTSQINT